MNRLQQVIQRLFAAAPETSAVILWQAETWRCEPPSFEPDTALTALLQQWQQNPGAVPPVQQLEGWIVRPLSDGDSVLGGVVFRQAPSSELEGWLEALTIALEGEKIQRQLQEATALQQIAQIASTRLDFDFQMQQILVESARIYQAEGALLLLPSHDQQHLELHQPSVYGQADWLASPLSLSDESLPSQAFQQRKMLFSNLPPQANSSPYRNLLCVPIQTAAIATPLGVLLLFNAAPGFQAQHLELARAISKEIGSSIESTQFFADQRQRASLMETINKLGHDLTATLDLRGVTRKAVENIHSALGYDVVFIALLNEAQTMLVCYAAAASQVQHSIEVGSSFPADQGMMGQAIAMQQTQLAKDLRGDNKALPLPALADCHSALAVPLKQSESQTIHGILGVASLQVGAFNTIDITALESLAAQVTIALDNANLYKEVQRRLLEQGIIHQIGQDLTSILDYDDLVMAIARHALRALNAAAAVVSRYNPLYDTIRIEAVHHAPTLNIADLPWQRGASYPLSERRISQAALRDYQLLVNYVDEKDTPAAFRQIMKKRGVHALITVPLVVGDRAIGLLSVLENRQPRRFTAADVRLIQTLAAQAAIAMDNAQLFQEAERRAREQALLRQVAFLLSRTQKMEELLELFVQEARSIVEADNAAVCIMQPDGIIRNRAEALSNRPLSRMALGQQLQNYSALWQALSAGKIVAFSPEIEHPTPPQHDLRDLMQRQPVTLALTPITHRGRFIGILEVSCNPPASIYSDTTFELLESLANQAAIAVENVRLFEQEQYRLKQLERVQRSGRLISSELVLQSLLNRTVQEGVEIFGVDAAVVLLPDQFGLNYIVHAAYNLSEKFVQKRQTLIEDYPFRKSAHQPIYLNHPTQQLSSRQAILLRQEHIHRGLLVPLVRGTAVSGILELYSKDRARHFGSEELEIAQLFAGQVAVALDNAELFHALEARARELAEAHRVKNQFLANISHELRTPMNSILGFSETLMGGLYGELNEKQLSRLERIQRNGRNLLTLIDDLLDISKIDAGRMELYLEPVDLAAELKHMMQSIESLTQSKGLYLRLKLAPDLPFIMADTLRLRQLINNLVGNAVKFTKNGGVTIEAELRNEVVLAPQPNDPKHRAVIWISVADTGIGISLEDQLVIFDEFRQVDGSATRQYGGTGLGLAICKRLVEMMNGRIWVDSEPDVGSTFTFVLPAATEQTPAQQE